MGPIFWWTHITRLASPGDFNLVGLRLGVRGEMWLDMAWSCHFDKDGTGWEMKNVDRIRPNENCWKDWKDIKTMLQEKDAQFTKIWETLESHQPSGNGNPWSGKLIQLPWSPSPSCQHRLAPLKSCHFAVKFRGEFSRRDLGLSIVMPLPNRWMVYVRDNPNLKWMMTGGTPALGNLQKANNLLVLYAWGMGVAGMTINSYCGSFPPFPAKHQ